MSQVITSMFVGGSEAKFEVHQFLLLRHSEYMIKALDDRWSCLVKGAIKLPIVDPEVFGWVVEWMYTDNIDALGADDAAQPYSVVIARLLELWIVADYLGILELRNDTLLHLTNRHQKECISLENKSIARIWEATTPKSSIRRWMLLTLVREMHSGYALCSKLRFGLDPNIFLSMIPIYMQIAQNNEGWEVGAGIETQFWEPKSSGSL